MDLQFGHGSTEKSQLSSTCSQRGCSCGAGRSTSRMIHSHASYCLGAPLGQGLGNLSSLHADLFTGCLGFLTMWWLGSRGSIPRQVEDDSFSELALRNSKASFPLYSSSYIVRELRCQGRKQRFTSQRKGCPRVYRLALKLPQCVVPKLDQTFFFFMSLMYIWKGKTVTQIYQCSPHLLICKWFLYQ